MLAVACSDAPSSCWRWTQRRCLPAGLLALMLLAPSLAAGGEPASPAEPAAAADASLPPEPSEPPAVESFDGFLARLFLVHPSLGVELEAPDSAAARLSLVPNVALSGGLGLAYGGFGASLSTRVPGTADPEEEYGSTDAFDLQVYYYADRFGVDLYYQRYDGFFVEEPGASEPGCERGEPCSLRPDLRMGMMGLNVFYVHSPEFSFKAAFTQAERQRRSAGSFLAMAGVSRWSIAHPGPLLAAGQRGGYGEEGTFSAGRFLTSSLAVGYAYSLVWRSLFVTPSLIVGGGVQHRSYDLADATHDSVGAALKVNIRFALGYNGESVFLGLVAQNDSVTVHLEELALQSFTLNVEFFGGFRL